MRNLVSSQLDQRLQPLPAAIGLLQLRTTIHLRLAENLLIPTGVPLTSQRVRQLPIQTLNGHDIVWMLRACAYSRHV